MSTEKVLTKKEKWIAKKKKVEKVLYGINMSLLLFVIVYTAYHKFNSGILNTLAIALFLINMYTLIRKDDDTVKNSSIYAETMAHSFLTGVLIINISYLFENNFTFNISLLALIFISILTVIAVNLERKLYTETDKIEDNLFFLGIEIALFNLIPAYIMSYFIDVCVETQIKEFFIGVIFIFLILVVFFVVKKIFTKDSSEKNIL